MSKDLLMVDPKERVTADALACFAAKGYSTTSTADIEAASGLTPGAGGTYRHFRSKREILDAVIDAVLTPNDATLAPPPERSATAAASVA
jgi:AcrR family transcriptional regulator